MIKELVLAGGLTIAALLLVQEIRHWWRPIPRSSPIRSGYRHPAPAARRVGWRLHPLHGQALLVAGGSALLFGLLTANGLFALLAGLALGAAAAYLLPRWQQRRRLDRARAELRVALDLLLVSLRAGRSLPTALQEWPEALAGALGSERSGLVAELGRVREERARGTTAEEALEGLARRVGLQEIRMLAGVVSLCRRRGGDLEQPLAQAVQMLADGLNVREEIRTRTAGKRMEGVLVLLLPPLMLLLLLLVVPSYMLPFIQSTMGRFILATVLLLEAASFLFGRWLLQGDL